MGATADGRDEERITAEVTRDTTYFFDSLIVLKVENTLFRIPLSHLLKHSEHFRGLYMTPQLFSLRKTTELKPFVVDGITAQEFRHFLRIILPFEMDALELEELWTNTKFGPNLVSRNEWISVLKVSTLWRCLGLRKLAIRNIQCFDSAAEQIVLGRKCYISSWVEAGYRKVVANRDISDEEMEKIGVLESFKLLRISHKFQTDIPYAMDEEINRTFREELLSIDQDEKALIWPFNGEGD